MSDWVDTTVQLVFSNVRPPVGVDIEKFIIDTIHSTRDKYQTTIEVLEDKGLHEMTEFEEIHMNLDRLNMVLSVAVSTQTLIRKAEEFIRLKAMDELL